MIDTHAHLDFPELEAILPQVLLNCRALGVKKIINPSSSYKNIPRVVGLSIQHPEILAAVGVHPDDPIHPDGIDEEIRLAEENILKHQTRVVAIGEIGLDYYRLGSLDIEDEKEKQQKRFTAFWGLAQKYQLPVIIHSRAAHGELFRLVKELKKPGDLAVVHCFSGDIVEALDWLQLGFKISVTGIITFKKSQALRDLIQILPIEQIMLETDSPYLAPEPFRGKVCTPEYLPEIGKVLAKLKGLDYNVIEQITDQTANDFFALKSALHT